MCTSISHNSDQNYGRKMQVLKVFLAWIW
uniref:Uncharacterized protein n=1 Tax=Rhizophora mucronata TaxID=61149 RepID=A0A2P2NDX0_RHIMU